MSYKKPTLGGFKKLQAFFASKGYPLPIFQTNIHENDHLSGIYLCTPAVPPEMARTIPIDDAIARYGPSFELEDVRLLGENGRFIEFSSTRHFFLATIAIENIHDSGWDCLIRLGRGEKDDWGFKDLLDSLSYEDIMNIARFGNIHPSIRDRFLLRFFPVRYGQMTFA